jgi:CDP-glucose 4,6-dehydratase
LDTLFAYLKIAEKQYENPAVSGAYNIGPEENDCATSGEIADFFCEAWGDGARWEKVHVDNPHESGMLKLDCSKIRNMLNWTPYWNIRQAVNESAKWYKLYFENGDYSSVMEKQIDEHIAYYRTHG